MKTITLRKLPPALAKRVDERASELGLSLNKTVIRILEESLTPRPKRTLRGTRHDDLDALAGSWTPEEASGFDRALEEQRRIDAEVWE